MRTLISVVSSWLCTTGVVVVVGYCIYTYHQNTPSDQKRAAAVASRISQRGTIPEYKSTNRHSSAVKKTTTAKVAKVVKLSTYVPNPIYLRFTNALERLTEDVAALAKDGEVVLAKGFVLTAKDGKPALSFPEAYRKVVIGGVAMGDELKCWTTDVARKWVGGLDQWKVEEVSLHSCCKRLDEPEFYCTHATYSVVPATRQVDAIRMHGNLEVGNTSKAYEVVEEVAKWMKEDFGAVDRRVATPAGTLVLKKFKIGEGMDVEVKVSWKRQRTVEGCDADIDISFTTGELVEENRSQRQELGQATETARFCLLRNTGVNYLTVRPKVNADAVKSKVVY